MAKKMYVGVSPVSNPGPFTSTTGWLSNQVTTLSVNGTALRVVSGQSSSTPGAYTVLTSNIPSGTNVTLSYTARGNVKVCCTLWNSSASGVLSNDYTMLTDNWQTFTVTGTLSSLVDRLFFFMTSPTTSSWFEINQINLSYSVAKKTKKMYVGVGNYEILSYIESTGTQYIDTNFNTTTAMKFVADISYTSFYGDDYDWFMGNRQANTNWLAC